MSLRINTNVEAFNAHRNLEGTSTKLAKSMERLSSGFRINRAADDAAGLAISEKLRGQIGGLDQARRNTQDGISLVQTAEGSLTEVHSMLQRVRELAVQHANGTLATTDRAAIVSEARQLTDEIERIGRTAQFNGIRLLDGSTTTITFQVGANDGEVIAVEHDLARRHDCRPRSTSRARRHLPTSTRRSTRSPISVPRSARSRTVWSTRTTTSPSTRRTCRRPSRASVTWTWRPRWSISRRTTSCSRPARACSRRPSRRLRPFCRSCARTTPAVPAHERGAARGGRQYGARLFSYLRPVALKRSCAADRSPR